MPGVLSVGLLLALFHPVQAAVFNIPPGDVAALINAINTANSNGQNDTINVTAGTYTLSAVHNKTEGGNGLPLVTSRLTIRGQGVDSTIITRNPGAPQFRILHVASRGALTLESLTITGGHLDARCGGGILNRGTLVVADSSVSGNDSGDDDTGGAGGGICNAGRLTLTDSTVRDNSSVGGGGIANEGTALLMRSTVSHNGAVDAWGGIANSGTLTLTNSTVSSNRVLFGCGGGIGNSGGEVTVTSSTISNNQSGDYCYGGGGLFGGATLIQTIVAGNTERFNQGGPDCESLDQPFTSLGYNLVGAGTGCPSDGPGDQTVDPAQVFTTVLGPLQDNGGPTATHDLLPGSPAIDMGQSVPCIVATDQRGVARPQGTACDIGAVESDESNETPSSGYQAEDAAVGGGSRVESNHSGFNGTGFVNFSPTGGFVEWTGVDGGSGGQVMIAFRYALGVGPARTAKLIVNGNAKNIRFKPTNNWNHWRYRYIKVNLKAGSDNTITIRSVGDDSGNIDELVLGM